ELALPLDRVLAVTNARDEPPLGRVEVHAPAPAGDDEGAVPLVDHDVLRPGLARILDRLARRPLPLRVVLGGVPRPARARAPLVGQATRQAAEDPFDAATDLVVPATAAADQRLESALGPAHRRLPRDEVLPLPQEVERLPLGRAAEHVQAEPARPA